MFPIIIGVHIIHFFPSPTVEGHHALLDINLRDVKVADDCNLNEIAKQTEGYSGADITNVCRYES